MDQQLQLVTLGVRDLATSRRFYLDWLQREPTLDLDEIVFVQVGYALLLGLFPATDLAADATLPPSAFGPAGPSPLSLARTVTSRTEVDETLARAVAAGATVVKPGTDAPVIDGYHCYFSDPDQFLWEIAYNPGLHMDRDGRVRFGGS